MSHWDIWICIVSTCRRRHVVVSLWDRGHDFDMSWRGLFSRIAMENLFLYMINIKPPSCNFRVGRYHHHSCVYYIIISEWTLFYLPRELHRKLRFQRKWTCRNSPGQQGLGSVAMHFSISTISCRSALEWDKTELAAAASSWRPLRHTWISQQPLHVHGYSVMGFDNSTFIFHFCFNSSLS
jgi:hypothetical protein